MGQTAVRKLKSTRGSGIGEALVGFLISVLSVMALLSVATTTLELIKQGDASILVLYEEEEEMDRFVNGGTPSSAIGTLYDNADGGGTSRYTIQASGYVRNGDQFDSPGANQTTTTTVKYYVTNRHHLFGFVPD